MDNDNVLRKMRPNYVSIPFKRESPFGLSLLSPWTPVWFLFQFPSNGKVLLDDKLNEIGYCQISFNSLQTGKSFWTKSNPNFISSNDLVSIPFKRESPFGQWRKLKWQRRRRFLFQFPSNGKVLLDKKLIISINHLRNKCFNSLQTGKSFGTWNAKFKIDTYAEFQFPSNGKVLLDATSGEMLVTTFIKFQFPSNGKVLWDSVYIT